MVQEYILDAEGNPLDLESFHAEDDSEFQKAFLSWKINPAPLDEVDETVDTELFVEDIDGYVRDVFKLRKKAPLDLGFREAGNLFRTTYWIFETSFEDHDYYVMLVRDLPMTEILMVEKSMETPDGVVVLSPFQAAAWDLLNPEPDE